MSRPPASRLELAIALLAASCAELRALLEQAVAQNPALRFAPFQARGNGEEDVDAELRCQGARLDLCLLPPPRLWRVEDPPPTAHQKEQANWLCEVLAERQKVLESVLAALVTRQRAYLVGERDVPACLDCNALAETLGIAEPTVRRTLQAKRLRTLEA